MAKSSDQHQQLNLERDVNRAVELLDKLQRTEYHSWLSKDVPLTKLQELQKVLQSDFFSAVREVYERVYETVDINGSPDIKANATAKATVAIFSASEGHSHPRIVTLPKTADGLGFNILGGSEQGSPIFISRIIAGSVAERLGNLKRGDQVLSVNGISVEGESHERAVELLKAAKDKVVMVVRYMPRLLEEIEANFERSRQQQPPKMFRK